MCEPHGSSSFVVDAPVVFQCKGCRTIVGDSLAFICSDAATKTLTLSAASRISRSADVLSSPSSVGLTKHALCARVCVYVVLGPAAWRAASEGFWAKENQVMLSMDQTYTKKSAACVV